jgi:hypothetical protein
MSVRQSVTHKKTKRQTDRQKSLICTLTEDATRDSKLSEKQLSVGSKQTILNHVRKAPLLHVVFFDVLGIILVLVGALYTHYHEGSSAGEVVFWVGIVLLTVALIIFVWSGMRKPDMSKT